MFSGEEQVERFRNMEDYFPVRRFRRAGPVFPLRHGDEIELPQTYEYTGATRSTVSLLDETDTTSLIVVRRDGTLLYENYWRGNDGDTHWISWSVGKSFLSMLIGIAISEGDIRTIDDPLERYAPELQATAYEGVTIRDALEMSSGVGWNEDYSDPESDIARFGRTLAFGSSMIEFAKTLSRKHEPGTVNYYNSMDAQVLGLVLERATGMSPSDYREDRVWSHIGAEHDGYWILDDTGVELAAGGVYVTARDYARFGLLYLNQGKVNGSEIVPADWVQKSHTPGAERLMPGQRKDSDTEWGYGYLWWLPRAADGAYAAVGIYNQFVYVDPASGIVIVKTSANSLYGQTNDESSYREDETVALFEAIVAAAGE
jgi:CubicO group peptidase (beta-lactamase class C family)